MVHSKFQRYLGLFVVVLALFLHASGCNNAKDAVSNGNGDITSAVLTVGPISYSLFEVEWAFRDIYSFKPGLKSPNVAYDATVKELVGEAILYLEGKRAGLEDRDDLKIKGDVVTKQYIGLNYMETGGPGKPFQATDSDVNEKEPERWEYISVSMIVLPTISEGRLAKSFIETSSFDEVAREKSIGPASDRDGRLAAPFPRDEAPLFSKEIHERLFSYEKGDITDPILTEMGWTIFRVDQRWDMPEDEIERRRVALRKNISTDKKFRFRGKIKEKYVFQVDKLRLKQALDEGAVGRNFIVGHIENEYVTMKELEFYAKWMKYHPKSLEEWGGILQKMGQNLLFYVDAVKEKADRFPKVKSTVNYYRRKLITDAYVNQLVDEYSVSDSDAWNYFTKSVLSKREHGKIASGWYGLRIIRTHSLEKAEKVKSEFARGIPFDTLFKQFNEDQSLPDGGLMVSMLASNMPWEIFSVISDVTEGGLSSPVKRPDGKFTLFLVEERHAGKEKEFSKFRKQFVQAVKNEKREIIIKDVLNKGKEKYPVQIIDDKLLRAKFPVWVEIAQRDIEAKSQGPHGGGSGH